MGIGGFFRKQFIDVIQWTEEGDGTLAWRFPMRDMEIQYGASLEEVVKAKQIKVVLEPGSLLYALPETDITAAVTASSRK